MSDLILNTRGTQFTRNQCRAAEFMKAFAEKEDIQLDIEEDCYVAPSLVEGPLLEHLCNRVGSPSVNTELVDNFMLFDAEATDEQLRVFQEYSLMLQMTAEQIDSTYAEKPNFKDYELYVVWFVKTIELLEQVEGIPQVDFNTDHFLIDYTPNAKEIKVAINLFGTDIISVQDVNKKLDKDVSIFANGLWGVYLVSLINGFGLETSTQNVNFYAQFIGATALQTTNLTTYFNLVQLFFSVFWLWLSDFVGRKPIFLAITAIYAMAAGLLTLAPKFGSDYEKEIGYLQGMRAVMGAAALIAPLGFLIVADAAPPKSRGVATIMINCSGALGGILASVLNIFLGSASKYNTKKLLIGTDPFNDANIASFVDAHYWSMSGFLIGFVICLVVLRETEPRIVAARHLKKMGIKAPKNKEIKAQPIYKVLFEMCKNVNLVILFFSYWINMIGATNSRTGAQVFVMRMYGFSDGNQAKTYINTVMIVSLVLAVLVSTLGSRWFVRRYGEIRLIIVSEVATILESVILFAINMPIPKETMYVTEILCSLTMLICDAIFLQLVSMYTTPQNRGQVLGIFEIGNSVGRTLSGVVTGVMYDYNIRDAQMFNTLFASVCLILLAIVKPPIQNNEMSAVAAQMKKEQKEENAV